MKKKVSLILIFAGAVLSIISVNLYIEPNLDAVSRLKAKAIVTEIIGETIAEELSREDAGEQLFIIEKGEGGGIAMVQANTVLINRKISNLTVSLQERYDHVKPAKIQIPLGSAFGSALLSQTDGGIRIRVLPLSVSKCNYETEFESQGINQTKYKIYVEIESEVRILQPFSQENMKIQTKMLLSEVVIVGDVPENYVYVPEEDILDVT